MNRRVEEFGVSALEFRSSYRGGCNHMADDLNAALP